MPPTDSSFILHVTGWKWTQPSVLPSFLHFQAIPTTCLLPADFQQKTASFFLNIRENLYICELEKRNPLSLLFKQHVRRLKKK